MPKYNYDALSPQDFEEVSRDLLQAEWGVAIEAFKSGRDGGVDLRYATSPGNSVIVQCKHFIHSGFASLLRHLKNSELPKIGKIKPDRYVVVTSVGLSPENKKAIVEALAPYIRSASDVIGLGDLDGLLAKHPAIERSNFKLWLTSTSVIDRVVHNAVLCHTEFEVERIRRKLPLFVQNEAYPRAREMLSANRIVVISGAPGIGKTTLAELLLYSNLEEGYEPVVIQGDIAEGKKLYRHGERQIFYYDDFLGQTFLGDRKEYFGRNQDKAIVDFMEMVRSSPNSRFILTTREHILISAIQLSERLDNSVLVRDRIVLMLGHYSFGDRARMVYNHLYFSLLSEAHKAEILRGDFFLRIIRHQHFNPRLIEWLASLQRVSDVPASSYQEFVQDLLDNPAKIWDHAFRNQISESGRSLLLVLYTVDWVESVADLEPAFAEFHAPLVVKYNYQSSPRDFAEALRLLEGAFLSISSGRVRFLNPSVKDYVASQISASRNTFDDLLTSAIRFQQLVALWQLANAQAQSVLRSHLKCNLDAFISKIIALLAAPTFRREQTTSGKFSGYRIDIGTEERLGFLAEFCNAERSQRSTPDLLDAMERIIGGWSPALVSFWSTPDLLRDWANLDWFLTNGGERIRLLVLDKLLLALPHADTQSWVRLVDLPSWIPGWHQRHGQKFYDGLNAYKAAGWREEWDSCETFNDRRKLVDNLAELTQRKKWRSHFAGALKALSEDLANHVDDSDEPEQGGGAPTPTVDALMRVSMNEAEVRDMFQTLVPTETTI
jgi:hypothetical protein